MKHEFVILDRDGVIVSNSDIIKEIYGSAVTVHDMKNKDCIKNTTNKLFVIFYINKAY